MDNETRNQRTVPLMNSAANEHYYRHLHTKYLLLLFLIATATLYLICSGFGWLFIVIAMPLTNLAVAVAFLMIMSRISVRASDNENFSRRPLCELFDFKEQNDRLKYDQRFTIPMKCFTEMYMDGKLDVKVDFLKLLADRYEWASFEVTLSDLKHLFLNMIPRALIHTKIQDQMQIGQAYDQDDDLYKIFLGDTMNYSTGIVSKPFEYESLDQLQNNNLDLICKKLDIHVGDTLLDLGCGYGSLVQFANLQYGAHATGITLSRNQAAMAQTRLKSSGIEDAKCRVIHGDYRDIPSYPRYKRICCIEMAEHVGMRKVRQLFAQIHDLLEPDGTFFLQIGSMRKNLQYDVLVWGIFMDRYIFPGSDISASLATYISMLEDVGFEVKSAQNIGAHSSATIWRWYQNWIAKESDVITKYGQRMFRMTLYYLASCMIMPQEGAATTFQLVLVNSGSRTDRISGIGS